MLKLKQQRCIELLVEDKKSQKEIADELRINENTITNWKKNEEFMEEYAAAIRTHMKHVAAKAFQKEVKLLSAESEMVQLMAAKDLLDRAGFKPEDNVNIGGAGKIIIVDDCDQ